MFILRSICDEFLSQKLPLFSPLTIEHYDILITFFILYIKSRINKVKKLKLKLKNDFKIYFRTYIMI